MYELFHESANCLKASCYLKANVDMSVQTMQK